MTSAATGAGPGQKIDEVEFTPKKTCKWWFSPSAAGF